MSDGGMEGSGLPPETASSPGAQLAARRQELGWTVEQVANQLNLAPRQVQAMEDNNYAALPGMVIARGFVRSYAKLLRLDPAPLLALIVDKAAPSPEALELRRTLSATFTESNLPTAKRSGASGKWLALMVALLVLAAGAWLALREGWIAGLQLPALTAPAQRAPAASEPASGEPLGKAGGEANPPATPEPIAPQAPSPTTTLSPALAPAPAATATPGARTSGADAAQGVAVAAAAAPARPLAGDATAAEAGERLVLKMREASWIELKRADGSTVASRLVPAGAAESFHLESGASLVVGNAAGVDAAFRGQNLDLTANAKNNVARLKLK